MYECFPHLLCYCSGKAFQNLCLCSRRNPLPSSCSRGKQTKYPATPFWLLKASARHVSKHAYAEIHDRRKVCIAMGGQSSSGQTGPIQVSQKHAFAIAETNFPRGLMGSLHAHLAKDPGTSAVETLRAGVLTNCCSCGRNLWCLRLC